jgi:2-oxoglutarate dehydrogenase E2 component (dihydrolipoamide succinyltransferase)
MSVELKVPEVGESITEVSIGKWYKSEGDAVDQDEQLVEIESEKATLDLRAPAAGVLTTILKKTGDSADVGEVIGQIDETGKQQPHEKAEAEPKREQNAKPKERPRTAADETPAAKKREEPEAKKPTEEAPVAGLSEAGRMEKARQKEAEEKAEKETEKPPKEKAAEKVKKPAEPSPREERMPMSPIRRRIAARLVEAQQNAALLTTFNDIDMTAIKQLRAELGEAFERRHGVRLGFMSFFVKAAVGALQQCPELNAIIDDDEIVYRRYYDIGVAISTDKGLVVPVLRDADRMSFGQVEKAIDGFAARARDANLKVDELQGGTFTITNGGVFGSLLSTPIVNPPQSGVLGMHAIQNRPVAVNDQVAVRPMMYVALTYDHRIVDGREAVTFLRRIKETIEEPARLLIEV